MSNLFSKPVQFLKEVRGELSKVAWSTREEVLGSTFVVIVVTGLTAILIFVIDLALSRGLNLLFR